MASSLLSDLMLKNPMMTLQHFNALSLTDLLDQFGDIYEHSPWVMATIAEQRPFMGLDELYQALYRGLQHANPDQQLALMRAHPELAGRAALAHSLTEFSRHEQAGAGLQHCSPEQLKALRILNDAYQERFGWPFIIAVTGLKVDDILQAMRERLQHRSEEEFELTLAQIQQIAQIRLAQRLTKREEIPVSAL